MQPAAPDQHRHAVKDDRGDQRKQENLADCAHHQRRIIGRQRHRREGRSEEQVTEQADDDQRAANPQQHLLPIRLQKPEGFREGRTDTHLCHVTSPAFVTILSQASFETG